MMWSMVVSRVFVIKLSSRRKIKVSDLSCRWAESFMISMPFDDRHDPLFNGIKSNWILRFNSFAIYDRDSDFISSASNNGFMSRGELFWMHFMR